VLKFEHTEVFGWQAAIRGMRNPKNSWSRSDSIFGCSKNYNKDCLNPDGYLLCENCPRMFIGPNDLELMMKLAKGGPVHAKYRRMIIVTVDITAPLYWWKEFDTYKVGTVANSCSTMHKIHEKEFTLDDFSCERLEPYAFDALEIVIKRLEYYRNQYNNARKGDPESPYNKHDIKACFDNMIQLLPTSYNQKRTIMLNYEVLVGMYRDRKNHKLDEWHTFCDWICKLPSSELITLEKEDVNGAGETM
jgi:hypothetical protein